ncbi:HNH endonuclease family protein [Frankia sp. R43]|uniref:HNH endonuclease family protein n=1 Tax=Frankia sp. R43 TaxID=269536 RepID=UPI0006C9F18B|nr:HNH endonuclease family protein [Frankia sp. R43]
METQPTAAVQGGRSASGLLPRGAGVLVAVLLAFLASGCGEVLDVASGTPTTSATPGTAGFGDENAPGAGAGSALELLGTLSVRAADNSPAYRRDKFGTAWSDVDQNGCDTRNDILHRDLRSITTRRSDDCIVLTGELRDPYTTRTIRFNRERNASAVQIDHVVALADAWRTGALEWSDQERLAFANDPENLLAVDGPTNQAKSDQDASEWLPPSPGARCAYVARQVGLKARYGLWVEQPEAIAMREVLQSCPDQPPLGLTTTTAR